MTVIHNAAIVTVDDRDAVHYGAAIAIDADRIAAIGPTPDILARYPAAERIDGAGKMVMPGFANIHTHFTMTLARGVFEDLSPPHKPPFSGGLSPIPLPDMNPDERRVMAAARRAGGDAQRHDPGARGWQRRRRLCRRAGRDRHALPLERARLRPRRHLDRRSGALQARPRAGPAPSPDHRGHLRQMERQGRRPPAHRRLGLGARHVLARAAARPARAAAAARHLGHHPSQPDLGRGRGRQGASQPAAHRVSGGPGLPARPADLRPLPLHGAERREASGRGGRHRGLQCRHRRAPRPQPAHRRPRSAWLHHRHGQRQHGRGHGRGAAHRPVHGAHPARGRPQSDARAGAALGDAATAIARSACPTAAGWRRATRPT